MFHDFHNVGLRSLERYDTHGALQMRWEVEALVEVYRKLQAKYVLEIGTFSGGTLDLWLQHCAQDALVVSVDLPGVHDYFQAEYRGFNTRGIDVRFVAGESYKISTFRAVRQIVEELDFLFLDGDHTYHAVKQDFELYGQFVRKGGIIAIHDILPNPQLSDLGVPRLWEEIREAGYITQELYTHRDQGVAGTGVVYIS